MSNSKRIIVASNNVGKIAMFQSILSDYEVITMKDAGIDIDVEENGETFLENAIIKAESIAKLLDGEMCLADDAGIEVEFLGGFPGVRTKRWFDGTDRERNLALIAKLDGVAKENRKVKFKVSLALSKVVENGEVKTLAAESYIEGFVTLAPRGENGFGFDEIFELPNGKTLAELTFEEKNEVAVRKTVIEKLKELLKSET